MHEPAWGMLIAIYLFSGGLSAGAMMLAAAVQLFDRDGQHDGISRAGALLAPIPVMIGTGLLVFDLGRPFFFWKLFVALRPLSPMWIGSWLLAVFALVALFYAYLHLPGGWRRWPVRQPAAWRRRCALAGLPLGFAVAVYTAVLLGVLVARPLWNTPLLSVIFVLSALSSGTAALILIAPARARHVIARWDLLAIGAETLVIAALLLFGAVSSRSAHNAVALLASGDYAGLFWIGVVFAGLVVPSAIELWAARRLHPSRVATIVAAWLVLAGGFLLRFVIVYAGQQSALS